MKRSQLQRHSRLKRGEKPLARRAQLARSALRARRRLPKADPRAEQFKHVQYGVCEACGAEGLVRRHHVVHEQHVRAEGGDPWDLRDGMWIGLEDRTCRCHPRHHSGAQRISIDRVPGPAIQFARELFGSADRAALYFETYYAERTTA